MGFLVDVVLPLALAFIMLALGLGLTFDDFARVVRRPRDFAVGALSQIVLLPAVAFVLASVWPMAPELALGLMIIAAAPGGATSNILTAFARGDVALSISLTAVISLVSVITIPVIVVFAYGQFIGEQAGKDISVAGAALGVFLIVAVPVLIGLVLRRFAESFALRFEPVARKVSAVLFVLVLAGAIYDQRANIVPYFAQGRAGHARSQPADDDDRLASRPVVGLRTDPANRHRDRMRPPERDPRGRGRGSAVRRRPRDRARGDLQPDHVRHCPDLYRRAAAGRLIPSRGSDAAPRAGAPCHTGHGLVRTGEKYSVASCSDERQRRSLARRQTASGEPLA